MAAHAQPAPALRDKLLTEAELLQRVAAVKQAAGSLLSTTVAPGGTHRRGEADEPEPEQLVVVPRAYSFSECESALSHGQLAEVRRHLSPVPFTTLSVSQ
jgi:hypothetical protein